MTGFGSGRAESEVGALTVELRSVNSRFLEVSLRLPAEYGAQEPLIRAELQKALTRGKVSVSLHFAAAPGATERYELNLALVQALEKFCHDKGSTADPATLLAIPGVVVMVREEGQEEALRRLLQKALHRALEAMSESRFAEGAALKRALLTMRESMLARLAIIEDARYSVVEKYRAKLMERIEELLGPKGAGLDPGRLEQEVALFADKADIAEETTRLEAHLARLAELLESPPETAIGRQVEFLNQEILREINTIGSKCRDLEITRQVLDLKNLAENLKEQIANVE